MHGVFPMSLYEFEPYGFHDAVRFFLFSLNLEYVEGAFVPVRIFRYVIEVSGDGR